MLERAQAAGVGPLPALHGGAKVIGEGYARAERDRAKGWVWRAFVLLVLLAGLPLRGQTVAPAVEKLGQSTAPAEPMQAIEAGPFGDRVDLSRDWLLHPVHKHEFDATPDAPAQGSFDAHDWAKVDTRKHMLEQGFWNTNELWYRTHVHLAPGSRDVALTLADIGGSYRVYVNGVEVGGHGTMRGQGDYVIVRSATYPIPNRLLEGGDLTIALHAFVGTVNRTSATLADGISPQSRVYLGPRPVLERDQGAYFEHGRVASNSMLTLWFVLLVLASALAVMVRRVPGYPLLAIYAFAQIVRSVLLDYAESHYLSRTQWLTWPINLAMMAAALALLEFSRVIAGSGRRWWLWAVAGCYVLANLLLVPAAMGDFSFLWYSVATTSALVLLVGTMVVLLLLGAARRRRDALLLVGCGVLYLIYAGIWKLLASLGLEYGPLEGFARWVAVELRPGDTMNLALILALFALMIVHTLGIVRERATIASEIEAARTMQQLLLARSSEPTPGFAVETAYLPAGEVGGDFFLVTRDEDGSLAAVVGDVSGKGLRAAMRVSMILGVLRRETETAPQRVLRHLNESLLAQAEMGFATACAVRLCADGKYTIANAGHLSPYVVGPSAEGTRSLELTTPPMLPLGIAAGERYEAIEGRLGNGERLVLLSDGVPEARSKTGELFGFERTGVLTLRPAEEIASTALAFGQEDDITVVTLACAPRADAPASEGVPPPPRIEPVPPPPRPA